MSNLLIAIIGIICFVLVTKITLKILKFILMAAIVVAAISLIAGVIPI